MPQRMIDGLFSKRTHHSLGKIKSGRQDLTFEQLNIYYQAQSIILNNQFGTNLELLTPSGDYNFVAWLMADKNNLSIKVAKYYGLNRTDLAESPDYGFESLIKATKQVLDKIELENNFTTKITAKGRQDKRPWSPIALREAILNAFIHNDYTTEVPPKFEIFDDRIEITSSGGLPNGLSQNEFFEGYSVPRNKEIMRIYKDIGLAEQLGSGVPRILEYYGKDCFIFSENFLRMIFPKESISGSDQRSGGSIGGSIGGTIGGPMGDPIGVPIDLTPRQLELIKIIEVNNKISYRTIARTLKISASAIKKHLQVLKEKGVLERIGGTRGYWVVKINQVRI